jgi:hypothetical protein
LNKDDSCQELINELEKILNKNGNKKKLMEMESVLQNMYQGKPGAGLTSAARREALWIDFFASESKLISRPQSNLCFDADYYFKGIPFSHKEIGWRGPGDLAISWSKNPQGGKKRINFDASMVLIFLKKHKKRKVSPKHGIYIIPVETLNDVLSPKLTANNKTDSLIKYANLETILNQYHQDQSRLFIPLDYSHEFGEGKYISDWPSRIIKAIDI